MFEKRIDGKLVKSFLDIIVMTALNGTPTHGYEIMATLHKEFGVLLSPGTLYPLLHSLEDDKLIESTHNGGRIVYQTTSKGKRECQSTLINFNLAVQRMSNFIKKQNKEIALKEVVVSV